MTRNDLIKLMQADLQREVEHMLFYLHAAVAVEGLHREELKEFFLKEAHEEMGHVHEFAQFVSYLGGEPRMCPVINYRAGSDPHAILREVVRMENEVAANYAQRLQQTEAPAHDLDSLTPAVYDPAVATAHVFYEDQIKNSQTTAWEVGKWLTRHPIGTIVQ